MSRSPPTFIPPDFTGSVPLQDGSIGHFVDGLLPRTGAPARAHPDGRRWYYEFGLLHNAQGPACIDRDGTAEYWHRGRPRLHPEATLITAAEHQADREAMARDFAE